MFRMHNYAIYCSITLIRNVSILRSVTILRYAQACKILLMKYKNLRLAGLLDFPEDDPGLAVERSLFLS